MLKFDRLQAILDCDLLQGQPFCWGFLRLWEFYVCLLLNQVIFKMYLFHDLYGQ